MDRHWASDLPKIDPNICHRCAKCGRVVRLTVEQTMLCSRCGEVSAWTISFKDLTSEWWWSRLEAELAARSLARADDSSDDSQ